MRPFLEAYAASLPQAKAYWVERETAQGLVRDLLDGLRDAAARLPRPRTNAHAASEGACASTAKGAAALEGGARRVIAFMRDFAKTQPDPDFYEVLDVARRIAGTGSLGLEPLRRSWCAARARPTPTTCST